MNRLLVFLAWLLAVSLPAKTYSSDSVRLVSLAPSLTELVYDMGLEHHLIGRTNACDYPEAAADLPVIGSFGRPTWELLVRIQPDVVLVTDLEKPGFLEQMKKRGMAPLVLPCDSWEQLKAAARAIADAVGKADVGKQWSENLENEIATLETAVEKVWADQPQRPSLYAEIWGQPITTVGRNTFLHEVMVLAGAKPLSQDVRGDYVSVSSEWLLQEDPDVILLAYMVPEVQAAQKLQERPGWSRLSAIQNDHIITTINPDWLLRPGPRLILGARALAEELQRLFAE